MEGAMTARLRKTDKRGRSVGNDSHARFYFWEWQSPAFRSLSPAARCLLLELKMLHNGRNNGSLFLSVREAARRVGVGKNLAEKTFAELRDRGFIRPNAVGAFNLKAGARCGMATSWVLTEFPVGEAAGAGSRDFMRWRPPSTVR
jgi:GNAT superfamily N-acetyltransferase